MSRVVIMGSGIAGLAAAIRLAVQGHQVTVLEQNAVAGGKIAERRVGRCRFDTGPSLLTWPQLIDELFVLAGKPIPQTLRYHRLPVICHYFFADGKKLQAYADPMHFADEVARVLEVAPSLIRRYLNDSARLFQLTREVFLLRSLHDVRTYLSLPAWRALCNIRSLYAWTTLHRYNSTRLPSPHLVQLFDRYATYNGSDPFQAPATLRVIPHLEFNDGAFLPPSGMYAIVQALQLLAEACGVRFYFSTPVQKILARRQVQAVFTSDGKRQRQSWPADIAVSNVDVQLTYEKFLDGLNCRYRHRELSTSAMVFLWEMNRTFPELGLHNIFFSSDYEREFAALKQGKFPADPTVYLNCSSKLIPSDAPPDHENWFVLINAPARTDLDWPAQIAFMRKAVIERMRRALHVDVEAHIIAEAVITAADLAAATGAIGGALYGSSSNHWRSAFLRHPNRSPHFKNLYFCGGTVHPGGGIPLCLLSARIVAELIARRHS
ncbi:MAG: phytoene desaturase family protein [Chitinophagales bacterium]|nr:phytoene desaturase family protein [Chitinophagales bacterium]MDW8428105.1 phytoene desaturase family protein [Chitinophagales bacterium]